MYLRLMELGHKNLKIHNIFQIGKYLTCIGKIQQWPCTTGCHWGSIRYVKFPMETMRCFGLEGFSKQNWQRSCCVKSRPGMLLFSSGTFSFLRFCFLLGASSKSYSSSALPDKLYCLLCIIFLARCKSASSSLLLRSLDICLPTNLQPGECARQGKHKIPSQCEQTGNFIT